MIKVTHVLRSLDFGGAEKLVLDLARLQKESGEIDPRIFCVAGFGPLKEKADEAGLSCEVAGLDGVKFLTPVLKVKKLLQADRPDIVHTHNLVAQVHAAPAARLLGIPVVHTKHGRAVTSFSHAPAMRKVVYGLSHTVVVVSQETGENFVEKTGLDPKKVTVIYNGIDTNKYARTSKAEARRDLELDEDAVVFGCVSRLDALKNHPVMIRAFAKVAGDEPRSRFLVVGDGPERSRIETLIGRLSLKDRVVMAGYTDRVAEHLAAMDMFFQPSTEEGLSLTILEAAASGVPVVATAVGGTPEIISHGDTGTLVGVGDEDAIADAMSNYFGDRTPFVEMAEKAKRDVAERFSLESAQKQYASLYRNVMGRKAGA